MGNNGRKPNRLIKEQSPYLLQHAYNPVDWYPWGKEALDKAKREDKPIFLSIGYSSCHWCHVMEQESFNDEEAAQILNDHYVPIKVDREERPDLDDIYMNAVQLLTGHGGWPLNVILTPDRRPIYGGTYFPPEDRYGRPGLKSVLRQVSDAYRDHRDELESSADKIVKAMQDTIKAGKPSEAGISPDDVQTAAERLLQEHDRRNGGFGFAPKFPSVNILQLLRQLGMRDVDSEYLDVVWFTLEKMARGGIYDQLGGGFHRYSTDERWLVPHFEKMLYDNALLVPLYLAGYAVTDRPLFRQVAEETLNWVLREMTAPDGGFYSTLDADSGGEEGKFYVWRFDELQDLLGEDADLIAAHYGVRPEGNFEKGTSILSVAQDIEDLSQRYELNESQVREVVARARQKLLSHREQREHPFRDEKIICSWNGMMIGALARAGRLLGESRYVQAAEKAAQFIFRNLVFPDGRLRRSFRVRPAPTPGFLADYAYLAEGLIELYQATFQDEYLEKAKHLLIKAVELFWGEDEGGFYLSPRDGEELIVRAKEATDASVPAASVVAARNIWRLQSVLEGAVDARSLVETFIAIHAEQAVYNPWGYASFIALADSVMEGPVEIVAIGRDSDGFSDLLEPVWQNQLSDITVYALPLNWTGEEGPGAFQGKTAADGRPTAYVCRGYSCSAPVTSADELQKLIIREVLSVRK